MKEGSYKFLGWAMIVVGVVMAIASIFLAIFVSRGFFGLYWIPLLIGAILFLLNGILYFRIGGGNFEINTLSNVSWGFGIGFLTFGFIIHVGFISWMALENIADMGAGILLGLILGIAVFFAAIASILNLIYYFKFGR